MRFSDFHVHTSYCDGKNTPKDMVMAAIDKNLSSLGLLCHSYLPFDEGYCIRPDKINAFKNEINSLKEQYKDKINIFCGVEADYFSSDSYEGFDYKIGSVHFVKKDGLFLPIDISGNNCRNNRETLWQKPFCSVQGLLFKRYKMC